MIGVSVSKSSKKEDLWSGFWGCQLVVEDGFFVASFGGRFPLELMFFFFLKKRFIKPPSGKTLKEPGSHNQGPKVSVWSHTGPLSTAKWENIGPDLQPFCACEFLVWKGGVIFPMFHHVLIAFELLFDGDELRLLKELLAPPLPSVSWSKLEGAGGPERSLLLQREVGDATFFGKRNWHTIFWC